MKKRLTALLFIGLFSFSAFGVTPPLLSKPCDKTQITSVQNENKLIICLSGMNTDGLLLKVFSPSGVLIEHVKLEGNKTSYEMNKPEKGIYWISMTNEKIAKFERVLVK